MATLSVSYPSNPTIRLLPVTALLSLLALAGGCQQPMLVDNVPPPNFNGPVIAQQPAPKPVAVAPKPAPAVKKTGLTGPAAWKPTAAARPWKWIVIHHSATPSGSADVFDRMHRDKGWDELGYHFVVGNGTNSGNGEVEVGPRWPKQKWGAHAKTADNRYNDFGIGICLVGNFDTDRPTPQQMQALAKLTAYLMKTYRISPDRIIGHGDTKATECPGRNMSIAIVRKMAAQTLADAGESVEPDVQTASADLTEDQPAN